MLLVSSCASLAHRIVGELRHRPSFAAIVSELVAEPVVQIVRAVPVVDAPNRNGMVVTVELTDKRYPFRVPLGRC